MGGEVVSHFLAFRFSSTNVNPILHTWMRDNCVTCDGSPTIQVFPWIFNIGMVNLTILKFSFKWVKVMLPYTGGRAACSGGWGAV